MNNILKMTYIAGKTGYSKQKFGYSSNNNYNNNKVEYNNVLEDLQYYIFDEKNMMRSIEHKIENNKNIWKKNIELNKSESNNLITKYEKNNSEIFVPKEQDSLFWTFYIIQNEFMKYESLFNKNEIIAKQMKIEYIEKIRKNKNIVKTYKFDTISNIETNLANDNLINNKTFLTLCAIENINIIFVRNKTYYKLLMNDSNDFFIVYQLVNENKNNKEKYGFIKVSKENEKINYIINNYYQIDNIDKPIKSISSYKLENLINICNKLSIDTMNKENNKTYCKQKLYELIIQFFAI
jgi:hypothetical protein